MNVDSEIPPFDNYAISLTSILVLQSDFLRILKCFWGCAKADEMAENEENCVNYPRIKTINLQWESSW